MNPETENKYLFISLMSYRKRKVFLTATVNVVLEHAMRYHIEQGHVIIAGYVIMPDHVHMLVKPAAWDVPEFVTNFKTYTGIKIKEAESFNGSVWRKKFYSTEVKDSLDFKKRIDLMHKNPVKAGLVKRPGNYPWSSHACYHKGIFRIPIVVEPIIR